MYILTNDQVRTADLYTMRQERIQSLELMERAAKVFSAWFETHYPRTSLVYIFCGTGNNGGDGLAIARLLLKRDYKIQVYYLHKEEKGSSDFEFNLKQLTQRSHANATPLKERNKEADFPIIPPTAIVIDALLGSGLTRAIEKPFTADLIAHINASGAEVVAVDLPSGLLVDEATKGACIHAVRTFSFERPRLAFFMPENEQYVGKWTTESIGLHLDFLDENDVRYQCTTREVVAAFIRPRRKFAHKGGFGHGLIVAGSKGMMGAAVLAATAALRSGAGLVTAHIPADGLGIVQSSITEAIVSIDTHPEYIGTLPHGLGVTDDDEIRYSALGIGCGIGRAAATKAMLKTLLTSTKVPMVLDADALNIIAEEGLQSLVPKGSILTPHPKEFARLFETDDIQKPANDFERLTLLSNKAREMGCIIVLKGAHSCISLPNGKAWFNTTGNPGMATAGSGDVLLGILTALLGQGYTPEQAAILGVYWHGLAGDLAAATRSEPSLIASDITEYLGKAWKEIETV